MKRGLKDQTKPDAEAWVDLIEESSPMKRGLKVRLREHPRFRPQPLKSLPR